MSAEQPPQTVSLLARGRRWRTTAGFAESLPLLDVDRVRHPERLSATELLKDNRVRTVARVPHPLGADRPALYVKRVKLPDPGRRLRAALRGSQAVREWRMGLALLAAGIPACRVLAVSESRRGLLPREAFLISEELAHTVRLLDYLSAGDWRARGPSFKRQLIGELAGLVVRLARAGLPHWDLHANNVMIAPDRPFGSRIFVLDLHAIRRRRSWRGGVLRMMVMLANSTKHCGLSVADRARFLREVLTGLTGASPPPRRLVRRWTARVASAWHRYHSRRMRSRTRRCVVGSKEFTRDRAGGFRMWRRREFPAETALATVESHVQAMAGRRGDCAVRKDARRTQVTLCRPQGTGAVYTKAFLRRTLTERVKDVLRPRSRAKAAWIAQRGYVVRGLPAARGMALLESRRRLSGTPDYVITEALDVVGNLQEITGSLPPQVAAPPPSEMTAQFRRELGSAVAELFRLLADSEVRHPDMKPANILVGRQQDQVGLWLVDLERSRFDAPWRRPHWIKHLAQLGAGLSSRVTLLDRMRCLRHCGRGRWGPKERLLIARAVVEQSRQYHRPWLR